MNVESARVQDTKAEDAALFCWVVDKIRISWIKISLTCAFHEKRSPSNDHKSVLVHPSPRNSIGLYINELKPEGRSFHQIHSLFYSYHRWNRDSMCDQIVSRRKIQDSIRVGSTCKTSNHTLCVVLLSIA